MKKLCLFFTLSLSFALFLNCCKDDNGTDPKPEKASVQGVITFSGDWPAAPAEIRMVALKKFPLESADDLIIGTSSLPNDAATHEYNFSLEPDTYEMIGVAWKDKDSEWDQSRICGIYYSGADSLNPGTVVLASGSTVAENINIEVQRNKAKPVSDATMTGKIYIDGAWPDSIANAVVIASEKDIMTEPFSLTDLCFSDAIAHGAGEFNYIIPVASTTYRTVGILFYKTGRHLTPDDILYSRNIGGLVDVELAAVENQVVEGPDITVSFGEIISGIKGRIILTGEWPAPAEEVRIIAATIFPPEIDDMIFGEQIPKDATTFDYTLKLRPADYSLVAVLWRSEGADWDLLGICGAYFAGEDSLAPSEVVVPDPDTMVENIDILVKKSKARKITDTKIMGKVNFEGNWPSHIIEARVIATTKFSIFPTVLPTLLDFGFSDSIMPGTESCDYVVNAFTGTFVATGVIFFNESRTLTVNDVFYSSEVGGLDLTPYTLEENEHFDGPMFDIKF